MEIRSASRTTIKPLIGIYGKSGSGKTMSALLLARGLAGPTGKVVLIDTENRRGSFFFDLIPGGYDVLDLDAPFSPERYQQALELAEKPAKVIVIDSLTHEHAGEGGVLDMQEAELDRIAGDNYGKREACKMASWIKPKIAHKKFIARLLRSSSTLICCLRGEEKTHMVKGSGNEKSKVFTDEFSTPIFDPRFIFEMLINFEVYSRDGIGGFSIPRKITHPDVSALIPKENEQMGIQHGEAIGRWCASPGKPTTAGIFGPLPKALEPFQEGSSDIQDFLTQIWEASEASELMEYIGLANALPEGQARISKQRIMKRAAEIGLVWSKQQSTFVEQ
jgi:AAA domain